MPARKKRNGREIVRSESKAIAVLSSSLVLRGLREFPHNPGWRVKQAFSGTREFLSISPRGYVAAYSADGLAQSRSIEIYDLELSWLPTFINIPGEPKSGRGEPRAALGWSPTGKSLVAASSAWPSEFHVVDVYSGSFRGCFGKFGMTPEFLAWSPSEKYFAASSDGSAKGTLQLWKAGGDTAQFGLLREADASVFEETSGEGNLGDRGKLWGFGAVAFHPDEKSLAVVLEYDGEWSDDVILLLRVPSLEKAAQIDATGHVTGLSWSRARRELVFCASGQAYVRGAKGGEASSLPFAAELCRCHPTLPLCAFYNSWLKRSEKGRIFVTNLRDMSVVEECSADGIFDLEWSADGRMLYAVAQGGAAYLYECHPE